MENRVRVESEPLAERGVVPAGIVGALGGGIAAVVLGAGLGTTHPEACGTAGAMLGSLAASLAWLSVAKTAGAVIKLFAPHTGAPTVRPAVPHA